MLNLAHIDWLIVVIYLAATFVIALLAKSGVKTSGDFLLSGRSMPAWIGALAFVGVSLGIPEVIGMGAWGAKYGLQAAQFFGIGAIPAMVFAGLFMMPLYYGSKARSVPDFLRLRFDKKTGTLSAGFLAVMTVFSSGIALYAIGRLIQELHLFDEFFRMMGWAPEGVFTAMVILAAVMVLGYIVLGGLIGAIYNQVLQFLLMVAALVPVVFLGLKNVGGWHGMLSGAAKIDPHLTHEWHGILHAGTNPMGIGMIGLIIGVGFALGAGYWCTNVAVIQTAMASQSMDAARRVPLIAAIPKLLFPFLVIVPGLIAIGLPTPHSVTTVTRGADGSIIHNIEVVSPQAEQGRGIVPARIIPGTGKPVMSASSQPLLDYDMATPNMLMHYLPTGLLGLGIAALLASFMSGMAGNVTAFNNVFTYDLYQSSIRKSASDEHYLAVGRWATVGAVVLSVAAAYAAVAFNDILGALLLIFSIVNAPLFATFLLGMFWKRTTGHGAFAGLISGIGAAILHHGLTLPLDLNPGIHGGWIAVLHRYPTDLAQNVYGAIYAFASSLIVAVVVSLITSPKPEAELVGMVHSLTPKTETSGLAWWRRPEVLGAAVLIAAILLNIFFA